MVKAEGESTAKPDEKGRKAYGRAVLTATGIGTAYVIVKSYDESNETLMNQCMVKVIVKSGNPSLRLVKDTAGLLSENRLQPDNSVTITMKAGQYDRVFVETDPEQSTDAPSLSWKTSGGVTVKNGVIYARKATKGDKPGKVVIKCKKSTPT